jgi:hypothetical protein
VLDGFGVKGEGVHGEISRMVFLLLRRNLSRQRGIRCVIRFTVKQSARFKIPTISPLMGVICLLVIYSAAYSLGGIEAVQFVNSLL